ncbi:MAG: hypothetical protein Ct9H300mP3_09110 [Gammaproteobacteria bacterium]|nr:MAG: hypothetical protein Ct9H300mP3_09110 [Gammaproteobacteria bacterium]
MNTMNKISLSGELETLPKERIWQETKKAFGKKRTLLNTLEFLLNQIYLRIKEYSED